jgi:glycerate kinase
MRILIAPNAFKNSLDATRVAEAISKGLQESKLCCTTTCFPVGDGGDGTASLLIQHLKGKIEEATVHNPLGRKIKAAFGLTDDDATAVIELADASGLKLLHTGEYAPLHTNTYGTGELIKQALDKGVKKIIIGIGGSATVDAGTGILQALGAKFYTNNGDELQDLPADLINLRRIDITRMDKRLLHTELIVLCDVENKLLGMDGAAAVFGPQKGAAENDVQELEKAITQLRNIVLAETGKDMAAAKHGGAAGGVAAGMQTFLKARLVNGIDHLLDITGFDATLQNADLVITGEGSIDRQTLQGKAPFGVAKRAKEKSIPVIGFAGKIPLYNDEQLQQYFDVLVPINNEITDLQTAIENTYDNLVRSARLLGNLLNMQKGRVVLG